MKRLPELDSIRGLAALGVVFWHYRGNFGAAPLGAWFYPFYAAGEYFVDLFFVLSGFVLMRAYFTPQRREHLWQNLWQRIARLYPLHLLTLLISAALIAHLNAQNQPPPRLAADPYHFLLNLLLLNSSGLQQGFSFNSPSWSISAEFWVNVLFFGVIARSKAPWNKFGLIAVFSLMGLLLYRGKLIYPGVWLGVFDTTLLRAALGFFIGALLTRIPPPPPSARLAPFWDVLFALTVAFTLTFMSRTALRDRFGTDFLLPLLVFPLMLYAVQHGSLFTRLLRTRPLAYLGEISYSVYLWHFPLQLLIMSMYCALNLPLDFWHPVTLLLLFVLIVLVSDFSYRFIEQPAQHWLRLHFRFHPST